MSKNNKYNLTYHCPCCGKDTVISKTEDIVVSFYAMAIPPEDLRFHCDYCDKEAVVELKEAKQ